MASRSTTLPISCALQPQEQKMGLCNNWKMKVKLNPACGTFPMIYLDVCVCGFWGNSDQLTGDSMSNWGQNWCPHLIFTAAAFSKVVSVLIVRLRLVIGVRVRLRLQGGI